MTWTELLLIARAGEAAKPAFTLFLQDIERMCQVAEADDYKPLSPEEMFQVKMKNGSLATRLRNFMDLASEVAKRSFSANRKEWSKFNNAWGPTWSGTYGSLSGFYCWIGLDASAWSEHGVSPLWLELIGKIILEYGNQVCQP